MPLEIAMEKLDRASGPEKRLSDDQKARIAEIERIYEAKIAQVKVKSVRKKMKSKAFAASVNREDIVSDFDPDLVAAGGLIDRSEQLPDRILLYAFADSAMSIERMTMDITFVVNTAPGGGVDEVLVQGGSPLRSR